MFRVPQSIGVGILLGGAAILATVDRTTAPAESPTTSVISCPAIVPGDAAVSVQPDVVNRPTEVLSMERALAYDSEFDRQRALFELAGDADPATLQQLIFDASRIGKSRDRRKALLVFFGRLTEMDPRSALALAQLDSIAGNKTILQNVWRLWSIADSESALREAVQLPNAFDREAAAQAMFSAYGHMDDAAALRISAATGISPNAENRVRYLYQLADESPTRAFDHINAINLASRKREATIYLARYFAQRFGDRAVSFATLLAAPHQQNQYLTVVIGEIAKVDPQLALSALSSVSNVAQQNAMRDNIFERLTRHDVYRARYLADQLIDTQARDLAYYRIIRQHARKDPVEAAGWVSLITNQQVRSYAEQQVKRTSNRNSR